MKPRCFINWMCSFLLLAEFLYVSDGAEEGVSRKRARAPESPFAARDPPQRLDYGVGAGTINEEGSRNDENTRNDEREDGEDLRASGPIPPSFLSPSVLEYLELGKSIPGRAGTDYPILGEVPYTNFYCDEQPYPGFFADPETRCQGWHYCDIDGRQATFLCPNGTQFSQAVFVCDWWFNVRCDLSEKLYFLNDRLYRRPKLEPAKPHRFITKDLLEDIFSRK